MKRAAVIACSSAVWLIIAASNPAAHAQVTLAAAGLDHIAIAINGQPFSDFYIGEKYPKPFLAPLRTATGIVVTRHYPMQSLPGESRDHPHHRGLWIGYGNVNGINFWENELDIPNTDPETPKEQGRIVLQKLGALTPGEKSGEIVATFDWRAPDAVVLLEERRIMTFYADPDLRTVDVDATLTARREVRFADTKEGFFAIRLADSMAGKNSGMMTNSSGDHTEKNVWGRRADWVDYDGTVNGQKVGIVIFDHLDNYNHPPRWHSRDYGLFAVNPFGVKDFEPNSGEHGGHTLARGESLRFRYRVIVLPGDTPKQKIADWYAKYTEEKVR
jgi:Methane oxygenase PmoA